MIKHTHRLLFNSKHPESLQKLKPLLLDPSAHRLHVHIPNTNTGWIVIGRLWISQFLGLNVLLSTASLLQTLLKASQHLCYFFLFLGFTDFHPSFQLLFFKSAQTCIFSRWSRWDWWLFWSYVALLMFWDCCRNPYGLELPPFRPQQDEWHYYTVIWLWGRAAKSQMSLFT